MIHASKLIPSVQQVGLIKTKLKAVYWEMEAPALLVDSKVYEFDLRKAIWFTSSGPICISLHSHSHVGFCARLATFKESVCQSRSTELTISMSNCPFICPCTKRKLCGTTQAIQKILLRLYYNNGNLTRNFVELSGEVWWLRRRQVLKSL